MAEKQNHWLKDVAAHAGLQLDLPRRPDISAVRKAWPNVARACKLADEKGLIVVRSITLVVSLQASTSDFYTN